MKNSFWVEVRTSYDGVTETGEKGRITDTWLIRAASFAEAEKRAVEEVMEHDPSAVINVEACTKRNIAAVWVDIVGDTHSKWYKARVECVTLNEKTDKEKRFKRDFMIFAPNMSEAYVTLHKCMKDSPYDGGFDVLGINLTSVTDVISEIEED